MTGTHIVFYDADDENMCDNTNDDMCDDIDDVVSEIKNQIKYMKRHIVNLETQNNLLQEKLNEYVIRFGKIDR